MRGTVPGSKKKSDSSSSNTPLQRTLSHRDNKPTSTQHQSHGKENLHNTPKRHCLTDTTMTKKLSDGFKTPTSLAKTSWKTHGTPECFNQVEMCPPTPGRMSAPSGNADFDDGFSVMVGVRVRPFSKREKEDPDIKRVITMSGNETTITTRHGTFSFCYDQCFWSFDDKRATFASQDMVYERVGRPLLCNALEGYNTCLFAYGQTGSGKSHTIMGDTQAKGIIPRFCEELFLRVSTPEEENVQYAIDVSFFEIYNEKIHDLLAEFPSDREQKKATLRVREHPTLGPYVEGLSVFSVSTFSDLSRWIRAGNKQRATAATGMNDNSSRSHSVFMIVLTKMKTEHIQEEEHVHKVTSKINLIDLAGSERSSAAMTSGDRLKEGANINKSLMTLGKVISSLSEKSLNPKKKVFIPYRDSVLTWLLRESLGGNSKTAMIATISPANTHAEETLSTLRYAKQAQSIINLPKVNEDPNARLIRELRAEVQRLTSLTSGDGQDLLNVDKIPNSHPNLINLEEHLEADQVLLYLLNQSKTRVGTSSPRKRKLDDRDDEDDHKNTDYCIIEKTDSLFCVKPGNGSQTIINGKEIKRRAYLNHGDRLVIGNHYYRFNHPGEVKKGRKRPAPSDEQMGFYKDAKFARNEILAEQEKKLQEELKSLRNELESAKSKEMNTIKENLQKESQQKQLTYQQEILEIQNQLSKCQQDLRSAEKQQRILQERSEALDFDKRKLEAQMQKWVELVQKKIQSFSRVFGNISSYKSKILDEMETEKQRIGNQTADLRKRRKLTPSKAFARYNGDSGQLSHDAPSVSAVCIDRLRSHVTTKSQAGHVVDHILAEMERLRIAVSHLKSSVTGSHGTTKHKDTMVLQATTSLEVTMSLLLSWCCHLQSVGQDQVTTLQDSCRKLQQQLLEFLQKFSNEVKEVAQSHEVVLQTMQFIAKLIGELIVREDANLKFISADPSKKINWLLRQAVVTGAETQIDTCLQHAFYKLTQAQEEFHNCSNVSSLPEDIQTLMQHSNQVSKTFEILLLKCQDTQFELASVLSTEEQRDSYYYEASYRRAVGIYRSIREGLEEIQALGKFVARAMKGESVDVPSMVTSVYHIQASSNSIGTLASTFDLIPAPNQSESSLESTSSSTSSCPSAPCKPSEVVLLAAQQVSSVTQNLINFLTRHMSDSEGAATSSDVEHSRHVCFTEPTSEDVFLYTKLSMAPQTESNIM